MKKLARVSAFAAVTLLALSFLTLPAQAKLSSKEWKSLNKQLKIAYSKREFAKVASLLDEIARDNSKRAYSTIRKFSLAITDAEVYIGARDALAGLSDKEAMSKFIKDLTKSKSPRLKVLLIDATAGRSDDVSIKAVNETLQDPRGEVVRAALETIVKRRHKSSIQPLIDLFSIYEEKKMSGLNVINTQKALISLTGKNLDTAEDYKVWWQDHKDSFRTEDRPTTGEDIKGKLSSVERGGKPKFFGSEINSRRIVFIIDTSGSMDKEDPLPPGKEGADKPDDGREVTGAGGEDKKKKGDKGKDDVAPISPSRVRLKRAQFQLNYVLSKLPRDATFTIIAYEGDTGQFPTYTKPIMKQRTEKWLHIWKDSLQGVSPGNVKSAQAFVNKFKSSGWTFTYNAILAAMSIPDVDNIVLLSDGGPNDPAEGAKRKGTGKTSTADWETISQSDIVKRITKLNAYHKIKIDTFGFEPIDSDGKPRSGSSYVRFLEDLAKENKGKFTPIR